MSIKTSRSGNGTDTATAAAESKFIKALTLTDATMLVAGTMIGSGIFIVSATIAGLVLTPFWLIAVWVLTGVITLLGALAYGELAAMFPRAGGQYVFLRESMGPVVGFLYGWTLFVVIQTGTIAAVAVAFGKFLGVLWPAMTPDLYSWFPHFSFTLTGAPVERRALPATRRRSRHSMGAHLDQPARRAAGQARADDADGREDWAFSRSS